MSARPSGWLLAALLLGGCAEPFDQPGRWRAAGANQANLDTEAVDRADTVAGHGAPGSDAVLDVAAVRRLYEDKPRPLRNESTTAGTGSQ